MSNFTALGAILAFVTLAMNCTLEMELLDSRLHLLNLVNGMVTSIRGIRHVSR